MTSTIATHKAITARENISPIDAADLVNEYGWKYRRFWDGTTATWRTLVEPDPTGERAHLYGAIWYTNEGGHWQRHIDAGHWMIFAQAMQDEYRDERDTQATLLAY